MFDFLKKFISIREGVFETNSSSMHALVVAAPLKDWKEYHKYVLKECERWKKEDGSYYIEVECNDVYLDDAPFSVRRYVPHKTLNDKFIYLYGTVLEHFFTDRMNTIPYDKSKWIHPENAKDEKKKIELTEEKAKRYSEYVEELKKYENELAPENDKLIEEFQEYLTILKDSVEWVISYFLKEKEEIEEGPKVEIEFKYYIKNHYLNETANEDDWFSLGCYDHEEFYAAVCRKPRDGRPRAGEWLCNPYSCVLAGSDEEDDDEKMEQETEARRCIENAFNQSYKYFAEKDATVPDWVYEEDKKEYAKCLKKQKKTLHVNEGKVIWPVGG